MGGVIVGTIAGVVFILLITAAITDSKAPKREYYTVEFSCWNCHHWIVRQAPLGASREDTIKKDLLCPRCKCAHKGF